MAESRPKIVVIDESRTSISLYERSAEALDVDLVCFELPEKALTFLGENPADLIFLDLLMRQKDGLITLRELRKLNAHAASHVVVVTSKDYFQDRAQAKQLGVHVYLTKPLRSQEIQQIILDHTSAKRLGEA